MEKSLHFLQSELRTENPPRIPLSQQDKPERHARLTGWALTRRHWEASKLNCQKTIIKITLSIRSGMSEFIETNYLIKSV